MFYQKAIVNGKINLSSLNTKQPPPPHFKLFINFISEKSGLGLKPASVPSKATEWFFFKIINSADWLIPKTNWLIIIIFWLTDKLRRWQYSFHWSYLISAQVLSQLNTICGKKWNEWVYLVSLTLLLIMRHSAILFYRCTPVSCLCINLLLILSLILCLSEFPSTFDTITTSCVLRATR